LYGPYTSSGDQVQALIRGEVLEILELKVASGNPCARQQAAIQLSLAGLGRPRRRADADSAPHVREDSWYAIDRLEHHRMPFVVALNRFAGPQPTVEKVREALALPEGIPVVDCDAGERESSKQVLITLVRHLAAMVGAPHRSVGRVRPAGATASRHNVTR
jgi:hypothetical protein